MPMCEKCWRDSADPYGDHADKYHRLVAERDAAGTPCTPQEIAGEWWHEGAQVDTRCAWAIFSPSGKLMFRADGTPEFYATKALADNTVSEWRKIDGAPYRVEQMRTPSAYTHGSGMYRGEY